MLVFVIISGVLAGWFIGNFLLDRWINDGINEVDDENKKPLD
jgi:hypothetical protein